jgi:iron complex outermembrane recepter protein
MFKRTKISSCALLALGGVLLAPTTSVFAQADAQRIEVTGSRIKRVDAETASPVQVISKEEIAQSGKGTVAEYLQTLTSDGQGSVPFTYGRGFSGATSAGVSLRGLGVNATLVLINGRRAASAVLADDAQRSYTDLNSIPLEAVERVEVLKDGASSIYGSDAVAGVVNIILKKNFVGTTFKASYGVSQERDGDEPRIALTHGVGDLAKDGYNLLLNFEFGHKSSIFLRDRIGRGSVGVSAIGQPQWGFDPDAGPSNNIGRQGGNGWIPANPGAPSGRLNNQADPSMIGNVRNPTTNDYYSRSDPAGLGFTRTFAGANAYCLANAILPQNNPLGGCITDIRQRYNQVQPTHETMSFFGRVTKALGKDLEAFVEAGFYSSSSLVYQLPNTFNAAYFQPSGLVVSQATTALGAAHPDNPYFGTAARLRYQAIEAGPQSVESSSGTLRLLAGLKGTFGAWDFDTALSASQVDQTDTQKNVVNVAVKNALLNPTAGNVAAAIAVSPAYAALPAGTYYRLGENSGLNSAAVYAALFADKQRSGSSKQTTWDVRASRELGQLAGGPIGLALGIEARHEENFLPTWEGQGQFAGLSLTRYEGKRDIYAANAEVLFPITKQLEVNAALRFDKYSTSGSSTTPKVGVKFKPVNTLALRGTYAQGFRAPGAAELNSLAGFGGIVVDDNARCAALIADGLSAATAAASCKGIAPTFTIGGNPNLKPEKSKSATLGLVWDVLPSTSLTADLWQVKRSGLIVQEDGQGAIDKGQYVRDPATKITANDPGAILVATTLYENANDSLTRGVDVEIKHRWNLGSGMGNVTSGLTWTHLLKQDVTAGDGTLHEYAGTHGNCDITNCIGSPRDRISFATTWDTGNWRMGANINYRGPMKNTFEQKEPDPVTGLPAPAACAQSLLNGADFPSGCKVKSFTTLDVSGAFKLGKNTEIFGSIANLFDSKPPVDFETYGAIGYNPLDYSGAIGRFFRIGLKHEF